MYAVVDNNGQQFKASVGDEVLVDRMNVPVGDLVEFNEILLVGQIDGEDVKIGRPRVEGARVLAEVLRHERGRKVYTVRFKGPSQTKIGHRQNYTRVRIQEIHPDWGVDNGS